MRIKLSTRVLPSALRSGCKLFDPGEDDGDDLELKFSLPKYKHFVQATKNRWIGKRLLDVFASEYSCRPQAYYRRAFELRRLKHYRQGKGAQPGKIRRLQSDANLLHRDHVLQGNENIEHVCIMTEAVVPYEPVTIISENDDFLVVNKPGGLPVYPQGPFEGNSLTERLAQEIGLKHVYPLSRLDRVTSGIIVLAKAGRNCEKLKASSQKYYLLNWSLPWSEVYENAKTLDGCNAGVMDEHQYILVKQPLAIQQHDPGTALKVAVDPNGKESVTLFCPLGAGDVTKVIGIPVTGRTHQLRAHSLYLNSPIAGDPLYDPANLNDTLNHKWWVVVKYTCKATELMLSWLDISGEVVEFDQTTPQDWHDLRGEVTLDQEDLERFALCSSSSVDEIVDGVYAAGEATLQRAASHYSDFGMMAKAEGRSRQLLSFHPLVTPHRIDLHSLAWIADDQVMLAPPPFGDAPLDFAEVCRKVPVTQILLGQT